MKNPNIRTYSELITLGTFEERFEYLRLDGHVGENTFGYERYLNQIFYTSLLWRNLRNHIIVRDEGCDLACLDRPLSKPNNSKGKSFAIYIHHLNPLTIDDIEGRTGYLTDPENLICCSFATHQAIHYGCVDLLLKDPIERMPNDTCPWKL